MILNILQPTILKIVLLLLFSFFQKAYAGTSITAKIQGIVLHADSMIRDDETQFIELKGHVQIIYEQQHLKADYAKIDLRSKKIECIGNVEIANPRTTSGGSMAIMDYENNTGILYDGYVQAGPILFEGKVINKTAENEYVSTQALYTACDNCPSSWSFHGSQIRAEVGGYAYIKNSILKFGPVPVLWLPFLVVPLKSERQTGLLTPEFEYSDNGGFTFSQPIYFAMSRSTDLTYTIKSYQYRGYKNIFNYRYVLSQESRGNLDFGLINDNYFKNEPRLNKYRRGSDVGQSMDRWFFKYHHYFETPDQVIQRAQFNVASDLQYPRDFPSETLNDGDAAMENRISLTKNSHDQHHSLDSSYYINLINSNPLADQSNSVHRLPEFKFSQMPREINRSQFYYSIDMDYTHVTRNGNSYDDMEKVTVNNNSYRIIKNTCSPNTYDTQKDCQQIHDGSYDENIDMIRTGQRLNFQPSIYRPFKLFDVIDILPKLSYKETKYVFQIPSNPYNTRRYIRGDIFTKTSFHHVYSPPDNTHSSSYKHEIIPELSYSSTPWIDQNAHPFYGYNNQQNDPYYGKTNISDAEMGNDFGIQFDYFDRITDKNLISVGLSNKITEKNYKNNLWNYQQIALIKLVQSYDLSPANPEPYSDIALSANLRFDQFETYSLFNYFPYQRVTNSSSRVRYTKQSGQFFQISLTKQYTVTPRKDSVESNRTEDYEFSTGFSVNYLKMLGKLVYDGNFENNTNYRVKSWAYAAQIVPPGNCWFITLVHEQITGGERTLRLNISFTFDGNTPAIKLPSI